MSKILYILIFLVVAVIIACFGMEIVMFNTQKNQTKNIEILTNARVKTQDQLDTQKSMSEKHTEHQMESNNLMSTLNDKIDFNERLIKQTLSHLIPVHFCTFGNTPKFQAALTRIENEALNSGFFSGVGMIHCFTQNDLPEDFRQFAENNPRGYGYWVWKFIILLKMFESVPKGHVIVYADAGCEFDEAEREKFNTWISQTIMHPSGRGALNTIIPFIEQDWTKSNTAKQLEASNELMIAPQVEATIQIYVNNKSNYEFVSKALSFCQSQSYKFVTDEPSDIPNAPSFVEHRHDQSVFSITAKQAGIKILERFEHPPIIGSRNRGF